MWVKIKSFVFDKAKDAAKDKAVQKATGSDVNVFSAIGYFKLMMFVVPITAIILVFLTCFLLADKAIANIYILQAVDPDFNNSGYNDYCEEDYEGNYDFEEYVKITDNAKADPNVKKALENSKFTSIDAFNEYLREKVDIAGYGTRAGVVAAGVMLSGEYSKYTGKRFNYFRSSQGHPYNNYHSDGISSNPLYTDCSNFAWWSLYSGGFKIPDGSTTKSGGKGWAQTGIQYSWASNNGMLKELTATNGKPGDFIIFRKEGERRGHIALIVGTFENGYYLAESQGAGMTNTPPYGLGVRITKRSYDKGKESIIGYKKGYKIRLIDMTEYYNNQDNVRTNAERQSKKGTSNCVKSGQILLIAGHSYEPYCKQADEECRPTAASGYNEPDETRSLVKLIKSSLEKLHVNVDIANELFSPNDSTMNSSFFVESSLNTDKFRKIDWSKYTYVLEVHFNGGGGEGPLLVKTSAGYSTLADAGIINAVVKNTGKKQLNDIIRPLNDASYFQSLNIPITYLETEFYDNKAAMDEYSAVKSQIASDIAKVISEKYGNVGVSGSKSDVVRRAKAEIGKPYVWAAVGPDGYDCSGLVSYALTGQHKRLGTTLTFWNWKETKNPQPGDVAVFDDGNGNGHTGIYIGKDENGVPQMVHAPQEGENVKIGPVQSGMKYVVYKG